MGGDPFLPFSVLTITPLIIGTQPVILLQPLDLEIYFDICSQIHHVLSPNENGFIFLLVEKITCSILLCLIKKSKLRIFIRMFC